MLLSKQEKSSKRQVAVVSRNPVFSRVLTEIMRDWQFNVGSDIEQAEVVFAERGIAVPETVPHRCWLSPMPVGDDPVLSVPLSLTELYSLLETTLFPSPRRHIRVSMDVEVDFQVDGCWLPARLISLSDRGGRLEFERELPAGTRIVVVLKLNEMHLQLPAEALYAIPAGDLSRRQNPHIGFLFKPLDLKVCQALRQYIELMCIERACAREQVALTDPCLSWFDLTRNPWTKLSK